MSGVGTEKQGGILQERAVPQVTDARIKEFVQTPEDQQFLSLEQAFGPSWEERAVSSNLIEILERRAQGRVTSIESYKGSDFDAETDKLVNHLKTLGGYIETMRVESSSGDKNLLLTNRMIHDSDGQVSFWIHEIIDPKEATFSEMQIDNSPVVWSYGTEALVFGVDPNQLNNYQSVYVDVQELGEAGNNYRPGFCEIEVDNPARKKRFADSVAYSSGDFIGMAPIKTLDDFYTFLHEFGHATYSAKKSWDDVQAPARKIYKRGLTGDGPMTAWQARALVSLDERGAWNFTETFVDWLRFSAGAQISFTDRLAVLPDESEKSLMTYDNRVYYGDDSQAPAFSKAMIKLREWYLANGQGYRFNPNSGEIISHCPLLQIAADGELSRAQIEDLLLNTKVIPENQFQPILDKYLN